MYRMKLQKSYETFAAWKAYSEMYGLAEKLGYADAGEAWESNPTIQGSTDPKDFKRIGPKPKPLTDVIFRKFKDGEIIALFPGVVGTNSPYTCSSYVHVGQHASADPMLVMQATKAAKPAEYKALAKELRQRGYNLRVKLRNQSRYLDIRRAAIQEMGR